MNGKISVSDKNCTVENTSRQDAGFDSACGNRAAEIEVDAVRESLPAVLDFVSDYLQDAGCPRKAAMQISLTAEEIFVNIASYSYPDSAGTARIILEPVREPAGIRLIFVDQGIPYDPLKKPDPDITLSAAERPIGGLGIFLVKKNMDRVEYRYEDNSNILTLTKYFTAVSTQP